MTKFIGHLKEVPAVTEWVATQDAIPKPSHIYLLLLVGHGKRRWRVIHLLTANEFADKDKRDWEEEARRLHPQSIQGLWIHTKEEA